MTAYYFDPEGGNDANDGTSFALRKKTWGGFSGSTGDELRIIASRTPYSLGNATWTDNSNTVTLATAATLAIDACDAAWTPSANVTASTQTGSALPGSWKEGTACARMAIASAFTTGIVAYHALGSTIDFSAYTSISLRFGASIALAAGVLRIDLCSDTIGAVPVASFTVPAISAGVGVALFFDNGSALPSNVQSVALYAISDPATINIELDNILACQNRASSTHLCHDTLIGKNTGPEPEWYAIRSISGTTITLGDRTSTPSTPNRLYRGVTETVTTYANVPLRVPSYAALGTILAVYTVTGGWDRSAMTSQTGESYLTGYHNIASAFGAPNGGTFVVTKVSLAHFLTACFVGNGSTNTYASIQGQQVIDNALVATAVVMALAADYRYAVQNVAFADFRSNTGSALTLRVRLLKWKMSAQANSGFYLYGSSNVPCNADLASQDIRIGEISNNLVGFGAGNAGAGAAGFTSVVRGATFANNTADFPASGFALGTIIVDQCSGFTAPSASGGMGPSGVFVYTNKGGNPEHGWIRYFASVVTQNTAAPPSGDTYAWEMLGQQALSATPITFQLSSLTVVSGSTYTIGWSGERDNTAVTGCLIARDPATGNDLGRAEINGTINTWFTYSFSFVAAFTGVVELHLGVYGTSTGANHARLANLTITKS